MNERLAEALDHISDKHITEAGTAKRRHGRKFLGAVAAILAVVILLNPPFIPGIVGAHLISEASGSRAAERPDFEDYAPGDYQAALNIYQAYREEQTLLLDTALDSLLDFSKESTLFYMEGAQDNRVWSPVNGYIALGMLAEITEGNSRQQVLDTLHVSDPDHLRSHVGALWENAYFRHGDGHEICVLSNSLWLDKGLRYEQEALDSLAHYHYASVFQTDLQEESASRALRTWLNNNTGGLLKDSVKNAGFGPDAVLTLASTVYLQSKWVNEFSSQKNTDGIFHSPSGDRKATFMNKKLYHTHYYWGECFGAVNLDLQNGTRMWFFLPDENKTPDDILTGGQYLKYLQDTFQDGVENKKYMKVNLSIPKFDISSSCDVAGIFQRMGITDVFDISTSNFTAITGDTPVVITGVNQAARVIIDEQGVKAAAYLEIPGAGAAMPPEEIIDFILDRPFLFVIASYEGVPLFTGLVNEP